MPKTNIVVASLSPELFTTKRLLAEATKLKHSPIYLNPYQCHIPTKSNRFSGIYFHRTTGTNYDDFDLVVSKYHEISGMHVSNPLNLLSTFRSKDLQSLFFKNAGLPSIPSLLYRGNLSDELNVQIARLSSEYGHQDKFILKMSRGNQGIGVNFLESTRSLISILETFHAIKDQRFLIQPFIPHKKEWRILILKGKILACIEKKISSKDFRGNAKRSSAKYVAKIPKKLEALAMEAFIKSGLDYAGIDILEVDSKLEDLLLLEINAIPGFEQAEELSGKNIAREIIVSLQ